MTTVAPARLRLRPALVVDVVERLVLLALFVRLVANTYQAVLSTGHWFNWLLVLSEGLGVFFIMIRKRALDVSDSPADWAIAFVATAGPLTVHPAGFAPLVPPVLGVVLLSLGLCVQIAAKLWLGRSFGLVPANRGVKASGPYRFVRHPMYLGYAMVHVGFLLVTPSAWNVAIYGLSFACQVLRILAEERLLGRDPAYASYRTEVRYRLLPGVF